MTLIRRNPGLAATLAALALIAGISVWAFAGSASAGDDNDAGLATKVEQLEAQVDSLQARVGDLERTLERSKNFSAERLEALVDRVWAHRKLLLEKIAAAAAAPDVVVKSFEDKDWDWDKDWGDKDWDNDWGDKDWGGDWDHHDHDGWDRD